MNFKTGCKNTLFFLNTLFFDFFKRKLTARTAIYHATFVAIMTSSRRKLNQNIVTSSIQTWLLIHHQKKYRIDN